MKVIVRWRRALCLGAAMFVSVLAYGQARPRSLIVFAASSLTDAFTAVAAEFESSHPGVKVIPNFAGSSTLTAQLKSGEVADVFASANLKQMTPLVDAGLIAKEAMRVFASNRLIVITPSSNPAALRSFEDLGRLKLSLVLAAPGVPVRDYADEMAFKMASEPAYGQSFRAKFYANLVSEESNVRQVAAKVALGEADAGIVYTTDVTPDIQDRVRRFEIPDRYNVIATYPVAVLAKAPQAELAAAFVALLLGTDGGKVLARYGFAAPPQR